MSTWRDIQSNLSERDRLLFVIAISLTVVAVLGNLILLGGVLYPRWQRWQEVNELLSQARQQLQLAPREQEGLTPADVRAEIEAAQAELMDQASIFMSEEEAAEALNRLYRYADETGVNILSVQLETAPEMEPAEDGEASTLYAMRIFRLEAQGRTNRLLDFLGQIEESAFPGYDVANVTLEAGESDAGLIFNVTLYTSPYASGVPGVGPPPGDQDETEALLEQAWEAKRWLQAIDLLDQLIREEPGNETWVERLYLARVNYGNQLLADGQVAAAKTQFDIALQINPAGTEAAMGLEQTLALFTPTPAPEATLAERLDAVWQAENWAEAITLLEQLRTFEPERAEWNEKLYAALVNYGYQLMEAGENQAAKEAFGRALDLNPAGVEAQEGLRLLSGDPTPVPPTPVLTATEPAPTIYTVRQGDTLYSIARRFGVTLEALMAANDLSDYNISVGQQLRIPSP